MKTKLKCGSSNECWEEEIFKKNRNYKETTIKKKIAEIFGTHNEEINFGDFNNHWVYERQEKQRKAVYHLVDNFDQMDTGISTKKTNDGVIKEKILLRASKDRKTWRTMITHLLGGGGREINM